MSELNGLSADPMNNAADIANYNVEFQDLQSLLFILSEYEFNGHRLFDLNGTQSFASGGITIDVNTTGAHHGVETLQITQLPYLAGLTFSENGSGNVQTTSGPWSDVNTGGDGGSVVAGTYSLAVNNGLNLSLDAVSVELFAKALENIASMRAGNADNYNNIIFAITNQPPQFQSDGNLSIAENTTFVFEFNATDLNGDLLTYSIPGGDDHTLFEINATTGALSFILPKDYEAPEDNNTDNIYELTIDVFDGNVSASLNLSLTIQDIDDTAPVITLIGDSNITHEAGSIYTDAGATWNDSVDGNGTADANGTVDH
ncbi:cadherin repeat domain-containing protein, partial [Opitutales bacterium]|nr:cadherin repeat domain-containing protein [Opitutales bacterium]